MKITCPKCNSSYTIADNKTPSHPIHVTCKKCGEKISITPAPPLPEKNEPVTEPQVSNNLPLTGEPAIRFKENKVIEVMEGGCGTLLVGSSKVPIKKMEAALNQAAAEGWQVVFQIIEAKRLLLFWTRESVIITLGR